MPDNSLGEDWSTTLASYAAAADWFATVTGEVAGRWDAPGLGAWSVRDLVGHTGRALLTVETYLAGPAGRIEVTTAADYYARARATSPDEVAERGRQAGRALGADPAEAVRALVVRVPTLVRAERPDRVLTTPVGGMRLAEYLPTRTFELVVHGYDLVAALQPAAAEAPAAAVRSALRLAAAIAADSSAAGSVLLALTGRRGLPEGFSLL